MDIGVRELKQNLSAYLARAARGETIRVTERGVPKALLGPIPGTVRLEEGVSKGWIARPATSAAPARVQRARASLRVEDVLIEDRGE
jgi:prevent-host-death family protein